MFLEKVSRMSLLIEEISSVSSVSDFSSIDPNKIEIEYSSEPRHKSDNKIESIRKPVKLDGPRFVLIFRNLLIIKFQVNNSIIFKE